MTGISHSSWHETDASKEVFDNTGVSGGDCAEFSNARGEMQYKRMQHTGKYLNSLHALVAAKSIEGTGSSSTGTGMARDGKAKAFKRDAQSATYIPPTCLHAGKRNQTAIFKGVWLPVVPQLIVACPGTTKEDKKKMSFEHTRMLV